MKRIGQWLVFAALTLLLLLWAIVLGLSLWHSAPMSFPLGLLDLLFIFLLIVAPGAALWVAGWIAEGFARND
jgi:hypothetical protein